MHSKQLAPCPPAAPTPVQFVADCRPFYAAGFNLENILLAPMAKMARKLAGEEG